MLCFVTEYFDLVEPVGKFQPSQVARVITSANWELTKGINIVVGHSGSGKTRILEAMKRPLKNFPDCAMREAPDNLSSGQKTFLALEELLQIQPANSCLLIDDPGMLDQKHMQLWWRKLTQHDKQVVIALGTFNWKRSAALIDMPVKLFNLELPPR